MDILSEMFSPVQLLAWGAACIYIISYQRQDANKTILLWAPADFLMAIHFIFMGAFLYLVTAVGGTIRSLIAVYCSKKVLKSYLIFYVLVVLAVFPFLLDGVKDYFAMAGTIFFSLSVWLKEKFIWHRIFAFGHQFSWIIAFTLLESYGGMALISFMFISNLIGTGRYLLTKKRNRSQSNETVG